MICIKCGEEIHPKRIKALPKTKVCVKCSDVKRVAGAVIISGKNTYSELQIISQEDANEFYKKQNRKGSGASVGVK